MTTDASAWAGQPILPVLTRNWWAVALRGLVAVLFGMLLLVMPATGILALLWLIGAYAVTFGILLIVLAFQGRNRAEARA